MSGNNYNFDYFNGTLFRWCLADESDYLSKMVTEAENKDRVVLLISVPKSLTSEAVRIIEKSLEEHFIEK